TVESVAEVVDLAVEASGADDILVRVVPIQTTEYVPGENPEDEISVLLIEDFDNPDTFNDIIVSCSGDRLQRLVISGPGGLGFDAAAALGLPISESCSCSNGDLLTVDVPYGIDLLTLRPRSRVRVSQALNDTSGLGIDFDLLLDVPTTTPQGYDPADDVYINSIEAELCYEPMVPGAASPSDPNSGVTVAFIDSGFDVQNWGEIFAQSTTFQGETPPCWQNAGFFFSQFGYNFLDGNGNVQDVNGHGTDVAATLLSNTPDFPLSVLHFKFFGDGQGSYFDALCASYVAAASGANILNWSWGFYETELPKSLGNLLINLQEQNVLAVAAAGNDSISIDADRLYPASASMLFDNVVAVTSYWYPSPINLEPRLTGFSNFSPSRVSAAAYATKQTPLINSPGLHSPAGTSISTPLLAQQFAEYWGQQRALGNAPGYNEVISTVFANLPDNAPELVQGVQDGRYLPVGCSDGDLPPP
ncbi:MAG: S8 family serine peptidase, partial [Bacteroidota bacterium]